MQRKEAQARVRINRLLEQTGWRFFPDKDGPDNIICECRTTRKTYSPNLSFVKDQMIPIPPLTEQRAFCVPTSVSGADGSPETVLRFCVVNPRTTADDLRDILSTLA